MFLWKKYFLKDVGNKAKHARDACKHALAIKAGIMPGASPFL